MTFLQYLQSLSPGNGLFKFLLLCLIYYTFLFIYIFIYLFVLRFILFSHFLYHLNSIKCFKLECFESIFNKFESYHCIRFYTFLLYFGTCTYLFSFGEGSCYVFSTRKNYCGFLASYGVTFQSVIKSINRKLNLNMNVGLILFFFSL